MIQSRDPKKVSEKEGPEGGCLDLTKKGKQNRPREWMQGWGGQCTVVGVQMETRGLKCED